MNRLTAVIMAALIGLAAFGSAAAAQSELSVKTGQQIKKQQWRKGGRYDGRGTVVANHSRHKLKSPPKGYRWIRDGDDFLLVATATGVIASIVSAAGK